MASWCSRRIEPYAPAIALGTKNDDAPAAVGHRNHIFDYSTPPSINIQGSNLTVINVGDTYTDLGAIVTDNQGHDLSYRTFINGILSGNILLDTPQAATDTIDYVATNTWGNTSTSTRTVIMQTASSSPSI